MSDECSCESPPFVYLDFDIKQLGSDSAGGEVSEEICKKCGAKWLRYLIEEPHHTKSGRWWRIEVTHENYTMEQVKELIESRPWCFIGGSYYNSLGKKTNAPIKII